MSVYDEVADLFMDTMTGQASMQMNGLTRAQLIEIMRAKFPTEETLRAEFVRLKAQAQAMFPPSTPDH